MGFFLGHGASPSHHHPISMGCSLTKTIQRSRGKPLLWKPHETGWATSNEQKSAWRFTCNSKEPTSRPKRSTRNSTYSIRVLNGELLFNQPFGNLYWHFGNQPIPVSWRDASYTELYHTFYHTFCWDSAEHPRIVALSDPVVLCCACHLHIKLVEIWRSHGINGGDLGIPSGYD